MNKNKKSKNKEPENIAELMNYYIDIGVPAAKVYEALEEYKRIYSNTLPSFQEIKIYFKKKFEN